MGIASKNSNNLGIKRSNYNVKSKKTTDYISNQGISESKRFEKIFPNYYSLDSILTTSGGYEDIIKDVLKEVMDLDFSILPFQDIFPFMDLFKNNMTFSTSPVPGMVFRDFYDVFSMLRDNSDMDNTLERYHDWNESEKKIQNMSEERKKELLENLLKFNQELLEEIDLCQLYAQVLGERWQNGDEFSLEEVKDFRTCWDSLFNQETDYDRDGTIEIIRSFLKSMDELGDYISKQTNRTPEDTILKLDLVKDYFNEKVVEDGKAAAFSGYLLHWAKKLEVKKQEMLKTFKNGGTYGQIGRSGGTYHPHLKTIHISLIPTIYEVVVNQSIDRKLKLGDTPDSKEISNILKKYPDLKEKIIKKVTITLLHEYAHHIGYSQDRGKTGVDFGKWKDIYNKLEKNELPSDYATTSPSEGYAETFAYYWTEKILSEDFFKPKKDIIPFIGEKSL